MEFSSKLLQNAVSEVAQLPGIGRRTALRLVLHLMRQPQAQTNQLSNALTEMREQINFCNSCHNISDKDICEICANPNRNQGTICVVEDIRDVLAMKVRPVLRAFTMFWVVKYLLWMELAQMI